MKSEGLENLVCEFSDAIVPYLYGEASVSESDRFESHVADCPACTDEFAELSFSRYSVFEWKKDEFVPMPTPQIVIPYARPVGSAGFFEGLREMFAFNWASAVGVAAAFTVIAGLGFVAVDYFGNSERQLAGIDDANKNVPVMRPASSPVAQLPEPKVEIVTTAPKSEPQRGVVAVKASTVNRRPKQLTMSNKNAPRLVNTEAVKLPQQQDRRTPSLTAGPDDDDRSLRLTDLFDSVDTRL